MMIQMDNFVSFKNKSARVKGRAPHGEDNDDDDDDDDDSFVASDEEDDDVSRYGSSDEEEPEHPNQSRVEKNKKANDQGLFVELIRNAIRGKASENHPQEPSSSSSRNNPPQHNVLSVGGQPLIQLPPLLPHIVLAIPPSNQSDLAIIPRAPPSPLNHVEEDSDEHWRATLVQKQADFLSTQDFFAKHCNPQMILYAKYNFAPQLTTPGIAGILAKANLDEVKTRLFIMMIIEKKDADIRHLPSSLSANFQELYSSKMEKDINEDALSFVHAFIDTFPTSVGLTPQETDILCRCYCAYWIFVKRLFRSKEDVFYLQLYESKGWGPVLFYSNSAILSSCSISVPRGKQTTLTSALDSQLKQCEDLISKIPSLSDALGINEREVAKRASVRHQMHKMTFVQFLDAFYQKHGYNVSYRFASDNNNPSHKIDKALSPGIFTLDKYDSACFSDLLYLSALHSLRKGSFLFNCHSNRLQMLDDYLENVCKVKEGMRKFIKKIITTGSRTKRLEISRGYAWLLMIYLKDTETRISTLNEKNFEEIMFVMSKDDNKFIKHILEQMGKTSAVVADEDDVVVAARDEIEYIFEVKSEMEMNYSKNK